MIQSVSSGLEKRVQNRTVVVVPLRLEATVELE